MIDKPQAAVATTGSGWVTTALEPFTHYFQFSLDIDAYVVLDSVATDPAQNGDPLTAGVNRVIECWGCKYVHHKRTASSNATLSYKCRIGSR